MVVLEETSDNGLPQGKPDKQKETAAFVSAAAESHPIFKKIEEGSLNDIQNLIDAGGISVEIEDKNGMTPLMAACWKGQENIVSYLLQQGADPNGGNHEHKYTALHFAGLAKKPGICTLLMEAGAKKHHTNSVKRTASAMAAFVGNHACVSVINNYVPKEDVYYYTKKQPFEESPKLPPNLAKPLHKLVMSMNSHPVSIAYFFRDEPALLQNISKIGKVLELMSDKEFKNRSDVNEVLSLKYHILQYIVKDIEKQYEKDKAQEGEKKSPFLERWIKAQLKGRDSDGYPVYQENFLRQSIKEFPFPEAQLFKMLVMNFSKNTEYGEDATAVEYINQAFNGNKGFKDHENCKTCGSEEAPKKCSTCKCVQYCDQVCQRHHWFVHKKFCPKMKEQFEKMIEENKKKATIEENKKKATLEENMKKATIEENKKKATLEETKVEGAKLKTEGL